MDPCLVCIDGARIDEKFKGEHVFLLVYVDDILLVSTSEDLADKLLDSIASEFKMPCPGKSETLEFLGARITKCPNTGAVTLDHTSHIRELVESYGLSYNNKGGRIKSPGIAKLRLVQNNGEPVDPHGYQCLVGKLQYIANTTRPDITYCTNVCARFTQNPSLDHWLAAKRIVQYLGMTSDHCIRYARGTDGPTEIKGWSDADWFGFPDGFSIGGAIIQVAGGPIMWTSSKQKIVAMSTAESEFVAAATTYRLLTWVKELFSDAGIIVREPRLIIDSTCAMSAIKTNCTGKRVRFINLRYRYLCHGYDQKEFTVEFTPSSNNIADTMTKPLDPSTHHRLFASTGIGPPGQWCKGEC
jgi:hypothetical protein